MQPVTLQTAVLMQVQEFASQDKPFSIHDITRTIREKTRDGVLEIPEVEVVGAAIRFDIPHTKVKDIFNESYQNGLFAKDFSLTRKFAGNYFEYVPVKNATSAVLAPIGGAVLTVTSATASPDDKTRIGAYLTNCQSRSFQPTIKQVQSAIKRSTDTCASTLKCYAIRNIIEKELGYTVTDVDGCNSTAQVVV